MAWLFNAIKALINWKLGCQDKWAEVDIHPLNVGWKKENEPGYGYDKDSNSNDICERFLHTGEKSTQGIAYDDEASLNQIDGCCQTQYGERAKNPA